MEKKSSYRVILERVENGILQEIETVEVVGAENSNTAGATVLREKLRRARTWQVRSASLVVPASLQPRA